MEQQLKMFRTGQELKREGIKKAETHANSVHKDWGERADKFLEIYAKCHRRFMAEDVRVEAEIAEIPIPPSLRAWGGVIQRAKIKGIIVHDGYGQVKNPKAHQANASIWRSLINKDYKSFNGEELQG